MCEWSSAGAAQSFVAGRMFWIEATDYIYAMASSGIWYGTQDTWTNGDAEYSCSEGQSVGVKHGFGRAWCNQTNIRSALGSSIGGEYNTPATLAKFDWGFILKIEGRTYVGYYNNGTWENR